MTVVLSLVAVLALTASGALAQQGGGEGRAERGTVQIDGVPIEEPEPGNEPHVGCAFQIEFFGFDDETAKVTVEGQAPTEAGVIFSADVDLEAAETGEDSSGALTVDITDELAELETADAEAYDHKVRVTVDTEPAHPPQKSAILFLQCDDDDGDDGNGDGGNGDGGNGDGEDDTGVSDDTQERDDDQDREDETGVLDSSVERDDERSDDVEAPARVDTGGGGLTAVSSAPDGSGAAWWLVGAGLVAAAGAAGRRRLTTSR